ncbi:MAG: CHASE4 domain-containing protein [Verrucomicrobiota bacterium]
MRLNAKVTLALILLIVVSVVLNYAVFYRSLYKSFTELENELAFRDLERCRAALARESEYLAMVVKDWAQWDDTYRYMADRNPEYEEANLQLSTFRDSKLALMQFRDMAGKVIWGRAYDLDSGQEIRFAPLDAAVLSASSPLRRAVGPANAVTGLMPTERGPMLVAANAILKTDGGGPARGVAIMGRLLDNEAVRTLGERVGAMLAAWPIQGSLVPKDAERDLTQIPQPGSHCLVPHGPRRLCAYCTVPDLEGNPALLIRLILPREVSAKGRTAALFGSVSIAAVGLLMLVSIVGLLSFVVLRPVSRLTRNVLAVRKSAALTQPVALARRDEIGTLSREFEETMKEWARAREQAEQANRAKTEFISSISHDMRTPLNGIIGLAELIAASPLRDTSRAHARKIIGEAENVVGLLNELLDTAKIEAGKLTLEEVPFELPAFVEEIGSIMGDRAMQKGLVFKLDLEQGLPIRVVGDPYRIRQILINLLGNALKFTKEGSVTLAVKVLATQHDQAHLHFLVRDTGIGIPADKQGRVFQRYVQTDASTARKFGGTGLGTSIARELVEMMGGEIGFESKEGQGSTFWFKLKLKTGEKLADEASAGWAVAPGGRVLLVEDYVTSQQVASAHLQAAGYTVDVAGTGAEALAKLKETRYDVVLSDVQLPDTSGNELTRRIRAGPAPASGLPIVAVTADASAEARRRCLDAGMNDVLVKPLRRDTLQASVAYWIRKRAAKEAIDWKRAVAEFGGDEAQVRALLEGFLKTVRGQMAKMGAALEARDLKTVRSEAHAMKGGAANLAADLMAGAAGRVEEAALAGKQEEALTAWKALEAEFKRLEAWARRPGVEQKAQGG